MIALKDAVASEFATGRSLWLTIERLPSSLLEVPTVSTPSNARPEHTKVSLPDEWLSELDWHFGFPIPRRALAHGESLTPVPGPERWPKRPAGLPTEKKHSWDPDPPTDAQLAIEIELLQKAKQFLETKEDSASRIRDVAEAWNLADWEAWRFIKAFSARKVVERLKWEEEEKGFGNTGKGKGMSRWWKA